MSDEAFREEMERTVIHGLVSGAVHRSDDPRKTADRIVALFVDGLFSEAGKAEIDRMVQSRLNDIRRMKLGRYAIAQKVDLGNGVTWRVVHWDARRQEDGTPLYSILDIVEGRPAQLLKHADENGWTFDEGERLRLLTAIAEA